MSELHERLVEARKDAGFATAREAANALGVSYPTYAGHENGSSGFRAPTGERYARKYKVAFEWLMNGSGPKKLNRSNEDDLQVRTVRVRAHVQAGHWTESWEWDEADQYLVAVPADPGFENLTLYAAETKGPSMNRRWPEGTVVVFTNIFETEESPVPGKRYLVERRRADGLMEHTVKLLHRDEDEKFWLVPESTDPRFQAPIPIDDGVNGGDTVRIVGRVRYAVTRE